MPTRRSAYRRDIHDQYRAGRLGDLGIQSSSSDLEGLDGLNIGLSTFWFSGLPLSAYGYSFAYQNWEYYLSPRGSLGLRRGPLSAFRADT